MFDATMPPKIADLFQTLAAPTRIEILIAIGSAEYCVCHLEALLGKRQAFLSQHLMALRKAGILVDRRYGRFIYYRLADPEFHTLIATAAKLTGHSMIPFSPSPDPARLANCPCPACAPKTIQIESTPNERTRHAPHR